MINVFIDTNIFIDYFLNRLPMSESAERLFEMCINLDVKAYTSPKAILDIHYFIEKEYDRNKSREVISFLLDFVEVQPIYKSTIHSAIRSKFTDFEDGVQYFTAIEQASIDCIVTNNKKDFKLSILPVYTAFEFIKEYNI